MNAEESRVIGGLETAVRNLEEQSKLNRRESQANFKEVFDILRKIQVEGCAVGKKNAEGIEDIRKGPDRAVARVSAISAAVAAGAALLAWWRG